MINNYDSFVYNLKAYFEEAGHEIEIIENDKISIGQIRDKRPDGIILSPGPKTPKEAGISVKVVQTFQGEIPILGVCLGHQTIGYAVGATIRKGIRPMHGKLSELCHDQKGLFEGLPQNFLVTRYHSLVIEEATLPKNYQVDAKTKDQEVMAISHRKYPIYGLQFHPEAVLTEYGHEILENFHKICKKWKEQKMEVCYV